MVALGFSLLPAVDPDWKETYYKQGGPVASFHCERMSAILVKINPPDATHCCSHVHEQEHLGLIKPRLDPSLPLWAPVETKCRKV